ncbi:MAG: hypothetical protein NTV54_07610 [Ignavibacteriales bacterium]|nr:hypothetical protein [Ignavibacteriales bacterium]
MKINTAIEYRLMVQPVLDDAARKRGVVFLLETIKQFGNFNYEIVVDEVFDGKTLLWTLHGLKAPELAMPASGAAQFRKVHYDLPGRFHFVLRKSDGSEGAFDFETRGRRITIKNLAIHSFFTVIADVS